MVGITIFSACDYYLVNPHRESVGFIQASEYKDPDSFYICYKEVQWPNNWSRSESGYKYGKDSLKTFFQKHYDPKGFSDNSGYITLRFIINCEGIIGLFKVHQVGLDYKEKAFPQALVRQLMSLIRTQNEWIPLQFGDTKYDSHIHFTFKIENGQLTEILP